MAHRFHISCSVLLILATAACGEGETVDTKTGAVTADGAAGDGVLLDGTAADAAAGADAGPDAEAPGTDATAENDLPDVAVEADVPLLPPDIAADVKADVPPSTSAALISCMTQHCSSELGDCLGDSGCAGAVGCLAGCKGDTGCMLACGNGLSPEAQKLLLAMSTCGGKQGCIQIPGLGGNCGNGKCDLGENFTCAKDCPAVCGDGKCDSGEQASCAKDCAPAGPSCGDGKCDALFENPFVCAKDCPAPKCGDKKCELPWETALTCAGDCSGGLTGSCGDGKCEGPFENPFTCTKDCPAPKCGDGACDLPYELTATCPADCKPSADAIKGNVTGCLASKCASESTACVLDFAGCAGTSLCVGGCKDMACVDACGAKLSGGSASKFKAMRDCMAGKCTGP